MKPAEMWRAGNGSRQLLIASVTALAAFLALIIALGYVATNTTTKQWDPLGEYPIQKVVDKKIRITEKLEVKATKCADENVTVTGTTRWQSIEPPGTIIISATGTGLRTAGCQQFQYENPIPDSVKAIIRAGGPVIWTITGTEIPIRDGEQGVPRAWTTEQFEVVP